MQVVLFLLTIFFFLTFFNRFAAVRSGNGEFGSGVFFLAGKLPYRDFYSTGPPVNMIKSALLLKLFGQALIVSRVFGVVVRILIAGLLFQWLRQMFRPLDALIASAVTIILSAGDRTDPVASYNHDTILCAMLCGMTASIALAQETRRRTILFALLSGVCGSLCLMSKQTIGLGVLTSVLVVTAILLYRIHGFRRTAEWVPGFLLGAMVPILGLALYLHHEHLLHPFIQMLFVQGPAAKAGHSGEFLLREIMIARGNYKTALLGVFLLTMSLPAILIWQKSSETESEEKNYLRPALYVLLTGMAVIGVGVTMAYLGFPARHNFTKTAVYFTFVGLTILLALQVVPIFFGKMNLKLARCILFCTVSWSVAFMLSLSWPAFEAMLLPGLGFLIAATLSGAHRYARTIVYGVLVYLVFVQVREKLDLPFEFDHLDEAPVRLASFTSDNPMLRGMRLPKSTVDFLDGTAEIIERNTRPGDTIFTYPEMGLIYALTMRVAPTFSMSHNIDVVNDHFAAEEAERLKRRPPAVIVYYRYSSEQVTGEEEIWRSGRRSGQRDLINAVEELVRGYRLEKTYRLTPDGPEIMVYVRPQG
jgi:hypothetical protein